ncbi:MAG: hypothetical protein DELT_02554 [Desulfovibrio sp.]
MRDVTIDIESMLRFDEAVDSMLDPESGLSGFLVAHGQAGRGKTVAAQRYHVSRGKSVYLDVMENWSQTAFLRELLYEVKGANGDKPRYNKDRCKDMIIALLKNKRMAIIVDEADRLSEERIEDLRDISKRTGAAIVFVAEEDIFGLLSGRRRFWSRVVYEIEFGPINAAEVAVYAMKAAGLDIPAEQCRTIATRAEGDFRLVRNMMLAVERAAKAAGTFKVDADMLETALATRTWRRG